MGPPEANSDGMKIVKYLPYLLTLLSTGMLSAQDCTLGVGGRDTDLIIQAFQLTQGQQEKLSQWTLALEQENGPLQEEAQRLLVSHPQQTTEQVEELGRKYRKIKETMLANAARYDRLLLGTFNQEQYNRYAELCREVFRDPMAPLREEATAQAPE